MRKSDHLKQIAEELQFIRRALESIVPAAHKIADALTARQVDTNVSAKLNDEELYELAKKFVQEAGRASTAYLQRTLGIGYARAAKLLDMLEENGVIGPAQGAVQREVYTQLTPQMKNILSKIEEQLKKKTKKKK